MGLDDFTSDNNEVSDSNNSSSSSSTSGTISGEAPDNSPSFATQLFSDMPNVTPRAIKYQIKTVNAKWVQQYSNQRFDNGEIIMYGYNNTTKMHGKTVAVFTTIQSAIDQAPDVENKDIHVVCWDLEENEALEPGIYISYEGDWQQELLDTLEAQIQKLDNYL